MFVKKLFEGIRIGIQLTLLSFQLILSLLVFIVLILPGIIIESILKPKKVYCKKCNSKMEYQGYPDELGYQKIYCARCDR